MPLLKWATLECNFYMNKFNFYKQPYGHFIVTEEGEAMLSLADLKGILQTLHYINLIKC